MTASELHVGNYFVVRHDPLKRPPRVAKLVLVLNGLATLRIVVGHGRLSTRATVCPVERIVREATPREVAIGMHVGTLQT